MGNKQQRTGRRSGTGGGELQKVFDRFDADGDGRISRSELRRALRAMGTEASDAEVGAMMEEMDSDRDGFVDLKEFEQFHRGGGGGGGGGGGSRGEEEEEELRDAFNTYDLDRNGLISAKELHMVMRRLGEKCSVRDCQRMIRSVDSDGDGFVSLPEFKKMMMAGGRPR